jgi:predicted MFS family arabinose efflux permease
MPRFIIFLFPVLIDFGVAAAFFITQRRGALLDWPPSHVAGLASACGVFYMACSLLAGCILTPANAGRLILASCAGMAALSVAFMFAESLPAMYAMMALLGAITAFFFAPFQVFMKPFAPALAGVAFSTGLYTLGWSTGFALGALAAGCLYIRLGWQATYGLIGAAAVIAAAGIIWTGRQRPAAVAAPAAPAAPQPAFEYAGFPNLAWVAWLCGGMGVLAWLAARGVFPYSGKIWRLTETEQGIVFFLIFQVQGLTGLALSRSRVWMYRAAPTAAMGLAGAGALVLFGFAQSAWEFYIAAALLGAYSGALFFYFVFHSLVHPKKNARYLAINEAVVGVCTAVGPWIAGLLGDADPDRNRTPYLAAAGVVAAAAVLQAVVHGWLRPAPRGLGPDFGR